VSLLVRRIRAHQWLLLTHLVRHEGGTNSTKHLSTAGVWMLNGVVASPSSSRIRILLDLNDTEFSEIELKMGCLTIFQERLWRFKHICLLEVRPRLLWNQQVGMASYRCKTLTERFEEPFDCSECISSVESCSSSFNAKVEV
jgi:hypothetical protein